MKTTSHELGRSMIEMLAVLAIIGVITVSALSGYSQAMTRYKASKTVTEIVQIADDVHKLYAWRRSYPTEAVECKLLGDEEILPNAECTNPFGGKYEVKGSADGKCLQINVGGLNSSVCTQIKDEIWNGVTLCASPDCPGCAEGASNCTFTIVVE